MILLLQILGIITLATFLISLLRVISHEVEINSLHKKMESRIANVESKTSLRSIAEGRINAIKKEFEPKIKTIERKRRFILDKIPFLKQ